MFFGVFSAPGGCNQCKKMCTLEISADTEYLSIVNNNKCSIHTGHKSVVVVEVAVAGSDADVLEYEVEDLLVHVHVHCGGREGGRDGRTDGRTDGGTGVTDGGRGHGSAGTAVMIQGG